MNVGRRIAFTIFTLFMLLGAVELTCQFIWRWIESQAFAERRKLGEAKLANNAINFMMRADGLYGYALKPGAYSKMVINSDGFAQRDRIPLQRSGDALRLAALGESTTMGDDVDAAYPVVLRDLVERFASNGQRIEMINGGVAGWVSDQVALRAESQIAVYRPQIVVLYVGWNDFQSYDPFRAAPSETYFKQAYGNPYRIESDFPLKLPVLLVAAYQRLHGQSSAAPVASSAPTGGYAASPNENYRFLLSSLDRIVSAFRTADSNTVVALSTLVGRWPHGGQAMYDSGSGSV